MSEFWNYQFKDTKDFVETFDELPLWSAPFGMLMLKYIDLKPNQTVLDIGSGTGFPLLELAERLGPSSKCYGLDPWTNANERAKRKIESYGLTNVEVIEGSADSIPFADNSIDMIVSNLGINNFEDPHVVFKECYRVLKPGERIVLTTNPNGHWKEFYEIFEMTLEQAGKSELVAKLNGEQQHRGTSESISAQLRESNFARPLIMQENFTMQFLNGTAFLNHHFVKLGWLASWKNIIPEQDWSSVFSQLELNLNSYAETEGALALNVPMLYIESKKPVGNV